MGIHKGRTVACFAAAVALAVAAGPGQQQQPMGGQGQAPSPNPNRPYLLPEANRLPDVNQQMEMRDQQGKQQSFAAANIERKKQIGEDSARLLKLATDLKAEVDKTTKDTLSLGVIRKADEIEKLAHSVKEKMKLSVGGGS
jgi:hypothetical protein